MPADAAATLFVVSIMWFRGKRVASVNLLADLHSRRGYVVVLGSKTANDDAADQRIFDGIRQSFQYTG